MIVLAHDYTSLAGHRRAWWKVGTRIMGNPFGTLGVDYCPACKAEVDADTQAHHRNALYTFKRWCPRCGRVLAFGAYRAPIMSDRPLPPLALRWVTNPELDRR